MSGIVAKARKPFPFRVELSGDDFHLLLKHARPQSGVARRLIAAEDAHMVGADIVSGHETDGLGLRALAIAHAPRAVPAIDKALKLAQGEVVVPAAPTALLAFPSLPDSGYTLFPSTYTFWSILRSSDGGSAG